MANKRYYWLKLKEDFFKSKEIKKLRTIAGGDTFVIIYLKMQLISLKNNGKLFFDGIDDDFASELALEIDEDVENVKVTTAFLERCSLLEYVSEDEYYLPVIPEITGSETQSTIRSRKSRALQCNTNATKTQRQCNKNATPEKEIETDTELTSEERKIRKIPSLELYNKTLYLYNYICLDYPECQLTPGRIAAIKNLMSNSVNFKYIELSDIAECFRLAQKSDFLKGKIEKFRATLDWMLKYDNFIKILEHKYNKPEKETSYDVDKFEKFAIGYKPPPRQQLPDFCQNCSCKNEYDCIVSCENPGWSNIVREKFREVLK